jgi:hypothetical protein
MIKQAPLMALKFHIVKYFTSYNSMGTTAKKLQLVASAIRHFNPLLSQTHRESSQKNHEKNFNRCCRER